MGWKNQLCQQGRAGIVADNEWWHRAGRHERRGDRLTFRRTCASPDSCPFPDGRPTSQRGALDVLGLDVLDPRDVEK